MALIVSLLVGRGNPVFTLFVAILGAPKLCARRVGDHSHLNRCQCQYLELGTDTPTVLYSLCITKKCPTRELGEVAPGEKKCELLPGCLPWWSCGRAVCTLVVPGSVAWPLHH